MAALNLTLIPTLAQIAVTKRRALARTLRDWRQRQPVAAVFLHEPGHPANYDWLVLSRWFVTRWKFPASEASRGPAWPFSQLRRPLPLRPWHALTGAPLAAHEGLWLTVHRVPVAYLVGLEAYEAWHHTKLQV